MTKDSNTTVKSSASDLKSSGSNDKKGGKDTFTRSVGPSGSPKR